eukprot:scaffold12213_cov115-Isochrysis_galbana.AAC.2
MKTASSSMDGSDLWVKIVAESDLHGMLVRVCERGAAARHARGQTSGQWETDGPRPRQVLTSRLGGSP